MYKFMTAEQLAKAIFNAPINTEFNFTFDSEEDIKIKGEQEGWHGTKLTRIFDEYDAILSIGYYGGGGLTVTYDMYRECDDCRDTDEVIPKITAWLNNYFTWQPEYYDGVVCVEVTDQNKKYLGD